MLALDSSGFRLGLNSNQLGDLTHNLQVWSEACFEMTVVNSDHHL